MSSGSLPIATYHRAQSLGAGTYGSVITVYNDDGEEFALKLFVDDDDDEEEESPPVIDVGALREISILRLFREDNAHKNIAEIADVKEAGGDEGEEGAGIDSDCMGVTMPLYPQGTLGDAIDEKRLVSRKDKVAIAHGLLSAVAHLHDNGIIHRDIKGDNVMLVNTEGTWSSVLIDFSLAKVVVSSMYSKSDKKIVLEEGSTTHTGEVGTVTYIAPEVVDQKPYGLKSDLWSVGVCLLEMIQNHTIFAEKNKEALRMVEEVKAELPDQPFANLVRGLLAVDPEERLSAREALASPLFKKFGLEVPPVSIVDIDAALPLTSSDDEDESNENVHPNMTSPLSKTQKAKNRMIQRREKTVRRLCADLGGNHPMTPLAALCYAQQLLELDDTIDDLNESQGLLDCVVLASRFYEVEVLDLAELSDAGGHFSDWSLDEYVDNEATLFMLMDYCLLPRCIKLLTHI